MTYETAKKLKDAGFPIIEYADKPIQEKNYMIVHLKGGGYDKLFIPTLSELIKACPKSLKHPYEGSTPEEAVANLWLELNNDTNSNSNTNRIQETV